MSVDNKSEPTVTNDKPNQIKYAGFWIRVGAAIADLMIISIGDFLIAYVFSKLNSSYTAFEIMQNPDINLYYLLIFLWQALFSALFICFSWQATPGMRLVNIYVVDNNFKKLKFVKSMHRFAIYFLPSILYKFVPYVAHGNKTVAIILLALDVMLAFFWYGSCAWNKEKKCIHDRIANTLVIYGMP